MVCALVDVGVVVSALVVFVVVGDAEVVCVFVVVGGVVGALVIDVVDTKLESVLESKSAFTGVSHLVRFGLLRHVLSVWVTWAGGFACASHREVGALILARVLALIADHMVRLSFLFMIGLAGFSSALAVLPWCRW